MNSRATTSSFHQGLEMFPVTKDLMSPSMEVNSGSSASSHSGSLLFNLSVLKDKLSQVQTLVGVILSPDQSLAESTSIAISSMNSTIQEIIVTATSMMSTCQQMMIPIGTTAAARTNQLHHQQLNQSSFGNYDKGVVSNIGTDHIRGQSFFPSTESEALDWFGESYDNNNINSCNVDEDENDEGYNRGIDSPKNYDVIELDAEDLLAKYTHYCQVCGKGFKRDANLRMHMRAHGDEYKTTAALRNTMKNREMLLDGGKECLMSVKPKKYSCPQEGCRWNQKHAKFQPLKSMVCVKNHYKRSHCPKMYVCKRCNQKQFSVLSDLRTHEKHCGDLRWQCSCGTTFSRKDKLMGHLTLFVGHQPATNGL